MVPHQIKPIILNLPIRRDQSTIYIDFICASCAESDYYRVVSSGQLRFDCLMYYGRGCRIQGMSLPPRQTITNIAQSLYFMGLVSFSWYCGKTYIIFLHTGDSLCKTRLQGIMIVLLIKHISSSRLWVQLPWFSVDVPDSGNGPLMYIHSAKILWGKHLVQTWMIS